MGEQVYFEDIEVGDEVPATTDVVTELQMFFFSAATYNGHRIHYDRQYATEVEGHPDILVHGPLQVALLARALTDWAGPRGRLVKLSLQNRSSAYPGETLRITGRVVGRRDGDVHTGLIDVELRECKGEGEGVLLMPATATVSLPRRDVAEARA
jgi:hydroxyacyl-ACP dehydratase HTD2-like protein with hotdog domain